MNSRLYDCRVHHSRTSPKKHAFSYRLFMFYVDLDEQESLAERFNLVGARGWAPYQLRTSDHYDAGKQTIKENIIAYLQEEGRSTSDIGKIHLLTHLRTFGHVFNPVSFYFVDDADGEPLYAIAEVDNTFNEQKLFLIDQPEGERFRQSDPKEFYVSPFSDLDTTFNFNLRRPDDRLRIGISQSEKPGQAPYFNSSLVGECREISDGALALYTLRFPAITMGILLGIHWQALLLWLKGHRARRKAEHPELQTGKHTYLKPHNHPTH